MILASVTADEPFRPRQRVTEFVGFQITARHAAHDKPPVTTLGQPVRVFRQACLHPCHSGDRLPSAQLAPANRGVERGVRIFHCSHSAPCSKRRNASATFSQQNKTRRPIFIAGIFFARLQLWIVRLLTGKRRKSSFSFIKSGVSDVAV